MGYFGFGRFRIDVAKQISEDFYKHYKSMYDAPMFGNERKVFFEKFDKTTKEFQQNGIVKNEVLHFLFDSDCEGKISSDFISIYPPGSPFIIPGEMIDKAACKLFSTYPAHCITGISNNKIKTVKR